MCGSRTTMMLDVVAACLLVHHVAAFFGGGGGGLTAMDMMRMQGQQGGAFGGMGMMGMAGMEPPPPPTYDQLYTDAVEAYSDEKWEDAIMLMEQALTDYRSVREGLVQCKKQCVESKSDDTETTKDFSSNLEFQYFHTLLSYAACVKKCKRSKFGNRAWADVSDEVKEAFETRNTYNYLQLAYYRNGNISKAARAASTYLYYNPDDETGQHNIKYYKTMGLNDSDFVSLESMEYMDAYEKGVSLYDKEDWVGAIEAFEDAIPKYLTEYTDCRLVCEGRSVEKTPDLVGMLSDNIQSLLQCRRDCPHTLAINRKKETLNEFFESHLHYLQFACYKAGDLKKAAMYSTTYLLYHHEDEVMLNNVKQYREMEGVSDEDFVARQDIYTKHQIEEAEEKLLEVSHGQPEEDDFRRQMEMDDPSMLEFPPPPPPEELAPDELSDSDIEVLPVPDEAEPSDAPGKDQPAETTDNLSTTVDSNEPPAVTSEQANVEPVDGKQPDEKQEPPVEEKKPKKGKTSNKEKDKSKSNKKKKQKKNGKDKTEL